MKTEQPILTISIAAKLLGLHPRTLMLYEKAGFISPHRTGTQRRLFTTKDLEEIQFLKYLTQIRRINLAGVKIILEALRIAEGQELKLRKALFPDFKTRSLL